MSAEPRAFVAGSTGYVGTAVVRALRRRGAGCVAHIRPGSRRGDELAPGFEDLGARIDRTPWELPAMRRTLEDSGITHVFCLIGTTRRQARAEGLAGDIYERVDYGLAALLADACAGTSMPPHLTYLSSIGANAASRSAYLRARGRAEAHIQSLGLSACLARPSIITGSDRPEARPSERAAAVVADGGLNLLGRLGASKLRDKYQSCTATELAERLIDLSMQSATGIFEGPHLL